jgi:hypothetical protein
VPEGVHLSRLSDFLGITEPCGLSLNLLKSDARSGSLLSLLGSRCGGGQRRSVDIYNIWNSSSLGDYVDHRTPINRHSHITYRRKSGDGRSAYYFLRRGHKWNADEAWPPAKERGGEGIPRPLHAPFPSILFFLVSKTRATPAYSSRLILVESVDAWGINVILLGHICVLIPGPRASTHKVPLRSQVQK